MNYKEINFEEYIERQLIKQHGYEPRSPRDHYDQALALDPGMLLHFIELSQPEAFEELINRHGEERVEANILALVDREIRMRGLLEVLRDGVKDQGVLLRLAYFEPTSGRNVETMRLFSQNALSVVRQLRYTEKNDNSIDMVLFLNGLPIFTVELKNQLSGQTVKNAISQYKVDRDPADKLLSLKRCLTHFAVDADLVYMTTRLDKLKTSFLPFNKGDNGAAGNPVNPDGYKTAYLWEDVWSPKSVLDLIGRFITLERKEKLDEKGKKRIEEKIIFPRYHQREAVRALVADAALQGPGHNYLIQHSAGSGKSNTIAWTAHRLSELHDEHDNSVFDSVIVVTDRRNLDQQLRETVDQFSQVRGVVKKIEGSSSELKEALENGERIITTTLQKFPVIVEAIDAIPGRRFAVIVDEAHSSQSGEGSKALKQVLQAQSLDDAVRQDNQGEETLEDMVLKEVRSRKAKSDVVSFFAFTATPKQKTLEIFGHKQADGSFAPFSLYTMKQAIQEGFILDVLQNYTPYRAYFELLKRTVETDDPEYDKQKAKRLLIGYVERHDHAIAEKTKIMVEHFNQHISGFIDSEAKAMIVTKSRLHAVRYRLAFDAYLAAQRLPYSAMVAFSGKVQDGHSEYTEAGMNGVPERNTADVFNDPRNRFLIVASKFQTGFDQPLLSAMYVDKKLGGVNAVQTLSRLNRTRPKKETTFVLDFVNETDDIRESFQPYYTTTILSEATDQHILYDLQRDLMQFKAFSEAEVEGFAKAYFTKMSPDRLNLLLDGVVNRVGEHLPDEQDEFKKKLSDYIKRYAFVSQILVFEDASLEMLYIFAKFLKRKLPVKKNELPYEILELINMNSYKLVKKSGQNIVLKDEGGILDPITSGNDPAIIPGEVDALSNILKDVNDRYGAEFTEDDRVIIAALDRKFWSNEGLEGTIKNNARDAAKVKFDEIFRGELIAMVNSHFGFYKRLDKNPEAAKVLKDRMFDELYRKTKVNK